MVKGFTRWEAPLRLASGGFLLFQGLEKHDLPADDARSLHDLALSAGVPGIEALEPNEFADLVSAAEAALGGLVLAPFVPRRLAGLGLMACGAVKLHVYWHAPGLRQEGSCAPTREGVAYAKDVWLFAIGLALFLAETRRKERARRAAA